MLPLLGIINILVIALESSCVGSFNLLFWDVFAAFSLSCWISSGFIAILLPFLDFIDFFCFFCSICGIVELLPNSCLLILSSPDMSIIISPSFQTAEDSKVLKRMNRVDPDDLSDYLCPSPVGRPSSLHKGIKRGGASSEPLPDSSSPVGLRRKKVRFVLPGEEDKKMGKQWKKSGWAWPGQNDHFKRMRDVSWGRRVFTAKYVVQYWLEHYRRTRLGRFIETSSTGMTLELVGVEMRRSC